MTAGRLIRRKGFAWGLASLIACLAILRYGPKDPLSTSVPSSSVVYDATGRWLRLTLASDEKYRLWTPLESMSPYAVSAALLYEDRYFYRHLGVNPAAIVRGFWSTYVTGKKRMGGSTISMQVARMLYTEKSNTLFSKLRQMLHASVMELRYSKRDILEAYLNLASYGANIEGLEAASLFYFKKESSKLTPSEALALTVIPASPLLRAPLKGAGPEFKRAFSRLAERWKRVHPAETAPYLPGFDDRAWPFLAPHFTNAVVAVNHGSRNILRTSLDLRLQRILERNLRSYVSSKQRIGIQNASALLVEASTMSIKALVGSADFFNEAIEGQVDGTAAKRSPGSTLKPFIYALALDQGLITSETMLKDVPHKFGSYNPENFDRHYFGPVSATLALTRSRNVPAVSLAAKLAGPSLYEFLKISGVSDLKDEGHYGLSLTLGGAEVSMREMVMLYGALANHGYLRPLRHFDDAPPQKPIKLLSDASTFIVKKMLESTPRPGISRVAWLKNPLPVAWKTGTSFGFHDAWTVGIFGPYILAVWIGHFNNASNPAFVGIDVAAPLFFTLIDALRHASPPLGTLAALPPGDVRSVNVCAVSGKLPTPHCAATKQAWFIPGKSPIEVCDIHRRVRLDMASGKRACDAFRGKVREETLEFWPSDLLKLFELAGLPRRVPPPFVPECAHAPESGFGKSPEIVSPSNGVTYTVRSNEGKEDLISFQATLDAGSREVFWFVDTEFVGKASRGGIFYWPPKPGSFIVRAVDDSGRSHSRELHVKVVR